MVRIIQKLPSVIKDYQRSRSAIYRDIDVGLFPKPISLGVRAVGWPSDEVQAIIAARISGYSEAEIRQLVKSLMAARKGCAKGGTV